MVIETALGDVQARRDLVDRRAAVATLVDQPHRGAEEAFAALVGVGRGQDRAVRTDRRARRRETVLEQVDEALLDPAVFFRTVAVEPRRQHVEVFEQHVRPHQAEQPRLLGAALAEELSRASEDREVAPDQHRPHRIVHRAKITEADDRVCGAARQVADRGE